MNAKGGGCTRDYKVNLLLCAINAHLLVARDSTASSLQQDVREAISPFSIFQFPFVTWRWPATHRLDSPEISRNTRSNFQKSAEEGSISTDFFGFHPIFASLSQPSETTAADETVRRESSRIHS